MPLCFRRGRGRPLPVAGVAVLFLAGLVACGDAVYPGVEGAASSDPLGADLSEYDAGVAEAIEGARDMVRSHREDAAAWGLLGMAFEANFIPHLALPAYEEAARLALDEAKWRFRSSRTHETLGNVEEADAAMAAAAALTDTFAPAHWRLGFSRLRVDDLDAAEAAFRKSIAIDRNQIAGLVGLARVHLQRDDPEAAIAELTRALMLRSDDGYAHALLGTAYGRLDRWEDAEREMALGQNAKAEYGDEWETEMKAQRIDTLGLAILGTGKLIEKGRAIEAIDILEGLREEAPDDLTLFTQLTHAYIRAERYTKGVKTAQKCLEIEPGNLTGLLNLAGIQAQRGEFAAARITLDEAVRLHPEDAQAHKSLGVVLNRTGDPVAAAHSMRRAWECDEKRVELLYDVGMLRLRGHEWQAAHDAFRFALARGHDTPDVQVGLAKALLELEDLDGAEAALDELRGRTPRNVPALNQVRRELAERRTFGGGD